jgi:hypothetical protein
VTGPDIILLEFYNYVYFIGNFTVLIEHA